MFSHEGGNMLRSKIQWLGVVSMMAIWPSSQTFASTCPAQEVFWPAGTKNACVADSVLMGVGQSRVLSSRGTIVKEPDGSIKITNRGEATVKCGADGKITISTQNCTSGVDAFAGLRASAPSSRSIGSSNPAAQASESSQTASSINNLAGINSFDKSSTREINDSLSIVRGATENYGVLGSGTSGRIMQAVAPFSAPNLRFEMSTKFGHRDGGGVVTTYIDVRLCTPRQCAVIRNFLDRGKYGGGGHYWGYEMSAFKTEVLSFPVFEGETITADVVAGFLPITNDVRLYFIQ